MVISRLDQIAASVSVVVRGSCNVTVNVCGVHFSVVSDGVPDAPPDTGQMIVRADISDSACADGQLAAAESASDGENGPW